MRRCCNAILTVLSPTAFWGRPMAPLRDSRWVPDSATCGELLYVWYSLVWCSYPENAHGRRNNPLGDDDNDFLELGFALLRDGGAPIPGSWCRPARSVRRDLDTRGELGFHAMGGRGVE